MQFFCEPIAATPFFFAGDAVVRGAVSKDARKHQTWDVPDAANNDITLKSAEEKSSYQNTNESSSFCIGASVGVGVGQGGAGIKFGLDGSMSCSEGKGCLKEFQKAL